MVSSPVQSPRTASNGQRERGFREDKFVGLGLTFDDILLIPAASDVLPAEVSTRTRIAADIELAIPIQCEFLALEG
ncbi:MAG: IMP dehydrogenase, partial [Dehalococcoidia bacterium]